MRQQYLWVERFRPKTVDECILSDDLKNQFKKFVEQGNIPHLILAGTAGTGKTTVAKAMCNQLDADYLVINASLNAGIDSLRNEIMQFASSVSFSGGRKYVILDEGDYLSSNVQAALRNFMEEYSSNCGFIITCNQLHKIIEPLRSRCTVINTKISKNNVDQVASQFMKRCIEILETINQETPVTWDKKSVAAVVIKYFPDFRKTLNELQRYAETTGKIDSGILIDLTDDNLNVLRKLLSEKNFTGMRKWVGENSDIDTSTFFRALYEKVVPMLTSNSAPQLVLILGEYQYKAALVADQEINIAACLTEIMASCVFKNE